VVHVQPTPSAPDFYTLWGFWLGVAGVVVAIVLWLLDRERFLAAAGRLWRGLITYWWWVAAAAFAAASIALPHLHSFSLLSALHILLVAVLAGWCQHLYLENQALRICPHIRRDAPQRWEELGKIQYGCIAYPGFLSGGGSNDPSGFGVELLRDLFPEEDEQLPRLEMHSRWRSWEDVLDGLIDNEYRIVATPLFATFDRAKCVRFSTPLFYSNIGLYMKAEAAALQGWHDLSFHQMSDKIRQTADVGFLAVEGEISNKLASKYVKVEHLVRKQSGTILSNVFGQIEGSTEKLAMFCESYFAENQASVRSGHVVNVLKLHEILYPVCFALRAGDYQLANLLNLRILGERRRREPLQFLFESLSRSNENRLESHDLAKHFVDKWPNVAPPKDVSHA
jgi:hypothetical protein